MSKLNPLPLKCMARHPDGSPIMIVRGLSGYSVPDDDVTVEDYNRQNGITPAQVQAMIIGSMWGWDAPGANPESPWTKNAAINAAITAVSQTGKLHIAALQRLSDARINAARTVAANADAVAAKAAKAASAGNKEVIDARINADIALAAHERALSALAELDI